MLFLSFQCGYWQVAENNWDQAQANKPGSHHIQGSDHSKFNQQGATREK